MFEPREDLLTEDDVERILRGILAIAGTAGATKETLERKFQVIADHLREIKFGMASYELFAAGTVYLDVDDDGEVVLVSAQELAERGSRASE
jgi:hypothetical protein